MEIYYIEPKIKEHTAYWSDILFMTPKQNYGFNFRERILSTFSKKLNTNDYKKISILDFVTSDLFKHFQKSFDKQKFCTYNNKPMLKETKDFFIEQWKSILGDDVEWLTESSTPALKKEGKI